MAVWMRRWETCVCGTALMGSVWYLEVRVQIGSETGQTKVTMRRGGSRGDMTAWEILGFGAEEMEHNDYGSGEDGEFAAE